MQSFLPYSLNCTRPNNKTFKSYLLTSSCSRLKSKSFYCQLVNNFHFADCSDVILSKIYFPNVLHNISWFFRRWVWKRTVIHRMSRKRRTHLKSKKEQQKFAILPEMCIRFLCWSYPKVLQFLWTNIFYGNGVWTVILSKITYWPG